MDARWMYALAIATVKWIMCRGHVRYKATVEYTPSE